MKISIGCDHGGLRLKNVLITYLKQHDCQVDDVGTYTNERANFVCYAREVAQKVANRQVDRGILCCGTGIGMSMAANKIAGVRAAVVNDCFSALATREHNDSNVLCLGERVTGEGLALKILEIWLNGQFEGGRHLERLAELAALEKE